MRLARVDAIVGIRSAIIKKLRDVEGESRGSNGGIVYEPHQTMSSIVNLGLCGTRGCMIAMTAGY